MPAAWKIARVFISSTFRDMQSERDYLVRFVFPRLREKLAARHIHLVEVDLRWGITSEQNATEVCREIITECRPRFLCMLGGRYGMIPEGRDLSITADEVHFGSLALDKTESFSYFYFRHGVVTQEMDRSEPGSIREPKHGLKARKLATLKREIRLHRKHCVLYHPVWDENERRLTGLRAFGDQVERDLLASIEEEFGTQIGVTVDQLSADRLAMDSFVESRAQGYVLGSRKPVLDQLLGFARDGNFCGYTCLTGLPGSGKSALLAQLCTHPAFSGEKNILLISHFVGTGPGTTYARHILRRLCGELKAGCPDIDIEIPDDLERLTLTFSKLLEQCACHRRVVIILDAINQIDQPQDASRLDWLPTKLPRNACIIFSMVDDLALERTLTERNAVCVHLKPLENADCSAIIDNFLGRYHKRFTEAQRTSLLAKQDARNPLYLLTALEELRTLGTYEDISRRIQELPDATAELCRWVMKRLEHDDGFRDASGEKVGHFLIPQFAALLALSRHGLTQADLSALLDPGDPLGNIAALLHFLRPYLVNRGGLIQFGHARFIQAVEASYLTSDTANMAVHKQLAACFRERGDPGGKGDWLAATRREIEEYPYHIWKAGDHEELDRLAQNRFLEIQDRVAPDDPDLALATLRFALDAACVSKNVIKTINHALDHALRVELRRNETPLDAIVDTRLSAHTSLHRAYALADLLEAEMRTLAHILLAWKLQSLQRNEYAHHALQRIIHRNPRQLDFQANIGIQVLLRMSWLEPEGLPLAGQALIDPKHSCAFAEACARCGLGHGIHKFIGSISNLEERSRCQLSVLQILIERSELESARDLTATINDAQDRLKACLLFTKATKVGSGTNDLSAFIDEAQSLVPKLSKVKLRVKAWMGIAWARFSCGQDPEESLALGLAEARSQPDQHGHAMSLVDVAGTRLSMGLPCDSLAEEALSTVSKVGNPDEICSRRDDIFCELALVHASYDIDETLRLAKLIHDTDKRREMLMSSAKVSAGVEKEKVLEAALAIAHQENDAGRRSLQIVEVLKEFAAMGKRETAAALAGQVTIRQSIPANSANEAIAIALASVGDFDAAVNRALAISNGDWAAAVLSKVATTMAASGVDASPVFKTALDLIQDISNPGFRDLALFKLSDAQLASGDDSGARKSMSLIDGPAFLINAQQSAAAEILKRREDPTKELTAVLRGVFWKTSWRQAAERFGFAPLAEDLAAQDGGKIALSAAKTIRNSQRRNQALSSVVRGMGETLSAGPALEVAHEINDTELRCAALKDLSLIQAKKFGAESGLGVAKKITLTILRIETLAEMAALFPGDKVRRGQLFAKAFDEISGQQNPQLKARALCAIGQAQRNSGENGDETIKQALTTALEIPDRLISGHLCKEISQILTNKSYTGTFGKKASGKGNPEAAVQFERLESTLKREGISSALDDLASLALERYKGLIHIAEKACAKADPTSRWSVIQMILPKAVMDARSTWRLCALIVTGAPASARIAFDLLKCRAVLDVEDSANDVVDPAAMRRELLAQTHDLTDRGEKARAVSILQEAIARLETTLGWDHLELARLRSEHAKLIGNRGDHELAADDYRKALDVLRASLGEHHPDTVLCLSGLVKELRLASRFAEAEKSQLDIIQNNTLTLGSDHLTTWGSRHDLSVILAHLNRFDEALALIDQILVAYRKVYPADHRNLLTAIHDQGVFLHHNGKPAAAEPMIREALDGYLKAGGENSSDVRMALHNLSSLLKDLEQTQEAVAIDAFIVESQGQGQPIMKGSDTAFNTLRTLAISRAFHEGEEAYTQNRPLDAFEAYAAGADLCSQIAPEEASSRRWVRFIDEKRKAMERSISAKIAVNLADFLSQNAQKRTPGKTADAIVAEEARLAPVLAWINRPDENLLSSGALVLGQLLRLHGLETDAPLSDLAMMLLTTDIVSEVITPAPDILKHSLFALSQVAETYGLSYGMYRVDPSELGKLPLPLIIHGKDERYLLVTQRNGKELEFKTCGYSRAGLSTELPGDLSGFVLAALPEGCATPISLTKVDDTTGTFVWG